MRRTVVFGAKGMLGSYMTELLRKQGHEVAAVDMPEVDITDVSCVEGVILSHKPNLVINCAAYTNVDACEIERDKAMAVNGHGPGVIAKACAGSGATFVHYSTDYVFDGKSVVPYAEDAEPHALSVYGQSKLLGEGMVKEFCRDYYILRTSWLFGENGKNFVETIAAGARQKSELTVVSDQIGSPTYVRDIAAATIELLQKAGAGTYHVSNSGVCSWYEFAAEIVSKTGSSAVVRPCTTEEYPRPAVRPKYSVMSKEKIERLGIVMRHWKEALHEYLVNRGLLA